MKTFQLITITLLICSLTACAGPHHRRSPKKPAVMNRVLTTTITPNGLKIFTYTVAEKGGPGKHNNRPPGGGPAGGHREQGFKQQIEKDLLAKLNETGFCREGYIELGRSIDKHESYIRGECREGATDKDLKRFSHTAQFTN